MRSVEARIYPYALPDDGDAMSFCKIILLGFYVVEPSSFVWNNLLLLRGLELGIGFGNRHGFRV